MQDNMPQQPPTPLDVTMEATSPILVITRKPEHTHDTWKSICHAALRQWAPAYGNQVAAFIEEAEREWTSDYWFDNFTDTDQVLKEFNNFIVWLIEHTPFFTNDGVRHSFLWAHPREEYYRHRDEEGIQRDSATWRRMCITAINNHPDMEEFTDAEKKEYIEEVEHQDGEGYWHEHFDTTKEVLGDVKQYIDIVRKAALE